MVQHVQNVRPVGNGVIGDELQLRGVAQIHPAAQLPAQEACGGLETLHQVLFVLAVQGADIDLTLAQVRGGVHMGDGEHSLCHPGVLHCAQQRRKLLADLLVDASDTIGCHNKIHPPFNNWRKGL